jgi:adenosylmethionine-8-amino-7-oxononanoate aminotransferase
MENVMANESLLRDSLNALRDIPIVGDVRGMGHFWAIELVRDQESKLTFEGPAAEWLLKDVLSAELWGRGMICRLDDRTEPIVQIAPPLVSDRETIGEISQILREALEVAAERMSERPELTAA